MAEQSPIVVEVKGLEELNAALSKFGDQWPQIANEALTPGLALFINVAKPLAPWDTGHLSASIGSQVSGAEGIYEVKREGSQIVARVGSAVNYASYQEYGTRFMSGKPYIRPALAQTTGAMVAKFEETINKVLQRLGLK